MKLFSKIITCVMKYLFDGINDGDTDFHVVGKDTLVLGLERPLPRLFGGDGQVH